MITCHVSGLNVYWNNCLLKLSSYILLILSKHWNVCVCQLIWTLAIVLSILKKKNLLVEINPICKVQSNITSPWSLTVSSDSKWFFLPLKLKTLIYLHLNMILCFQPAFIYWFLFICHLFDFSKVFKKHALNACYTACTISEQWSQREHEGFWL